MTTTEVCNTIMAHLQYESLRYVLSDQAIVALVDRAPMTTTEVCNTINQADPNVDLSFHSLLPSPSAVVCCHLDKIGNFNDIFPMIIHKKKKEICVNNCF